MLKEKGRERERERDRQIEKDQEIREIEGRVRRGEEEGRWSSIKRG